MRSHSRREFLTDVGRGMLVAGIGANLAADLGVASAFAAEPARRLTFGDLEPLVSLMQETPIASLLPRLIEKLNGGTELKTLVTAGALANVRTFGGQDYTGYHAFMALPPALEMSREINDSGKALPVLKVLYRNSARIQAHGGSRSEILHPIDHQHPHDEFTGPNLQKAVRTADVAKAEQVFAATNPANAKDAFDHLQYCIQDEIDVHRVVLSWRAWTMVNLAGLPYAHSLLRQSVRFCVEAEKNRIERKREASPIRTLLPKLFDEHKLAGRAPGTKPGDDAWLKNLADTIYRGRRHEAAEAVAMALAEGFSAEAVGEAISLASTMLVLRDPGRERDEEGKPKGSVHGASVGVHASDSANAWRNISRVSPARNRYASLIVGAYHTAEQNHRQRDLGVSESALKIESTNPKAMIDALDAAVRNKDQASAAAIVTRYGAAGHDAQAVFTTLLPYAVSEDGALHAEKYYRTIREEFVTTRPAYRWMHLAALARVTASEYGFTAPGYAEAKGLLKLS